MDATNLKTKAPSSYFTIFFSARKVPFSDLDVDRSVVEFPPEVDFVLKCQCLQII